MADTWITPERKKDLLNYVEELKKISGGPVEEEDLYAAGFSERDLEDIGWFNKQAPMKAPDSTEEGLAAYEPTYRENLRSKVSGTAQKLGFSKRTGGELGEIIAGNENPTDGSMGLGLADFTPLGIPMGVQEGARTAKRGWASGKNAETALGIITAGANIAAALPGAKLVAKGVSDVAEKFVDAYDPSIVRTFFGPTSKLADLEKLKQAKTLSEQGVSEEEIWKSTGWWNGPNGWRFEVDDSSLSFPEYAEEALSKDFEISAKTPNMLPHPDFWDALSVRDEAVGEDAQGQFSRAFQLDAGSTTLGKDSMNRPWRGVFKSFDHKTGKPGIEVFGTTPEDLKETAVHELQHAAQWVLGDLGKGANKSYIQSQFSLAFDNIPVDLKPVARRAIEAGYTKARFDFFKEVYKNKLESYDRLTASYNGSYAQQRMIERQSRSLEQLSKKILELSGKIEDFDYFLNDDLEEYPTFAKGLKEFQMVGFGTGSEYLKSGKSWKGLESVLEEETILDGHKLKDWAAYELYHLEAGELEARVAGSRAHMTKEERAENSPSNFVDVHGQENIFKLPDFTDWLDAVQEEAKSASTYVKRKYNKGGDVKDVDPISGNEVPPGAKPEEVRDDIDAKLSEGEYVIPADVVRYLGLDKIEKLVQQAKEGLAEMEKQGRIGGEPVQDDLPFTDEELMSEPIQMAAGGLVPNVPEVPRPNIVSGVFEDQVLPPWFSDQNSPGINPTVPIPERKTGEGMNKDEKAGPLGMAGPVESWRAKDFSNAVKQRSDIGSEVVQGIVGNMIPFGGAALRARHRYLDKKVPGAIDNMLKTGKDVDGTPLTEAQKNELRKAKEDFAATKGYRPGRPAGGFKGLINKPGSSTKEGSNKEDRPHTSKTSGGGGFVKKPSEKKSPTGNRPSNTSTKKDKPASRGGSAGPR